MRRSQKTSPSANLLLLAILVGMRFLTQVDWQIRLGHMVHAQPSPGLIQSFAHAGAPAPRERQTRCEAGTQSPRTCEGVQAAGLPNGGGVLTRSPRAPPLRKGVGHLMRRRGF